LEHNMTELRKVLRLTKHAYAVTIPAKYREAMKLGPGNYLEISLVENQTLIIKKHKEPEKP
jgi:AbrB family looped-hinge helix DNA binding protein